MWENWKKVTRDEYYRIIELNPNELTIWVNCTRLGDIEEIRHDDFTCGKMAPFSHIGKIIMYGNYPELNKENEYFVNDIQGKFACNQ